MDIRQFLTKKTPWSTSLSAENAAKEAKFQDQHVNLPSSGATQSNVTYAGAAVTVNEVITKQQLHNSLSSVTASEVPTATGSTSTATIAVEDDLPKEGEPAENVILSMPYQPPAESIPHQYAGRDKKNCLKFQMSWYQKFPWIHFDAKINAVVCFTCVKAESLNMCELSRKWESTFITGGYRNWKKL
jgi:hypothetical protein